MHVCIYACIFVLAYFHVQIFIQQNILGAVRDLWKWSKMAGNLNKNAGGERVKTNNNRILEWVSNWTMLDAATAIHKQQGSTLLELTPPIIELFGWTTTHLILYQPILLYYYMTAVLMWTEYLYTHTTLLLTNLVQFYRRHPGPRGTSGCDWLWIVDSSTGVKVLGEE